MKPEPVHRMRSLSCALGLVALLVAGLGPTPARAQSLADESEVLYDLGARAYESGRFQEALLHFMQSNRLSPNAAVAVNIGHTYTAMQKFPEAYRWYLEGQRLGANPETVERLLSQLEGAVVLLRVESNPPGADIYLDRRNLGKVAVTPATLALEPGDYKVILDKESHESFFSETISLPRVGRSATVQADLKVVTGSLRITGDDFATVHVGDERAMPECTVPCTIDLPIGKQIVYFKKPGYRSQPAIVDIVVGRRSTVTTDMVLVTGSVRVETSDRGALVEIDGQPAGFTPAIVTGVPAGRRTVKVSRPGAVPQVFDIDVPKDGQVDLGTLTLARTNDVQSASRTREDIFEAPASISVIRKEELDAFRYPTLVDSLRGVRGVHTQSWYGANTVGTVGIRGLVPIPAVDPGQRTRFLRDGLVMETQTNSYGLQSQRAQEVQSIEVQRGAGSVLYGTGAISGLVSVFTRDRVRETSAEVEASTIGREAQGRAFFGGGDEELGAWVSVNGFNLRGMDFVLQDVPTVLDNGAVVTDAAGVPVLDDVAVYDMQPASGISVETKAWARDLELRYAHLSMNSLLNYGVRITPNSQWDDNNANSQRHLLDLVYQPSLSDAVDLDTRVYGQSHRDELALVGAGLNVDRFNEDQWGGVEARTFISPVAAWRDDDEELRRLRFSLGTEFHTYPRAQNDQVITVAGADPVTQVAEENGMSVLALYALMDARPVRFFALSVGGRVDQWNQKTDFIQFNPRAVGMLFPTNDDVIKLIAGRGFRVGDISERLTETPPLIALPGAIDPETAWTYEAEYSHRFDSDWTVLASAWQASIEGLIEQRPITDPADPDVGKLVSQNAFNGLVRGLDAEVARTLRGGWMLTAWVSVQDPRSTLIAGGSQDDAEILAGAPTQQAAAKAIVPLLGSTKLATRVVYEGPRQLSGADGTTDAAVLADVVVSGAVAADLGSWFVGAHNLTARETFFPASTSTFATVQAPEFRKPLLRAGLELTTAINRRDAAARQLAKRPVRVPAAPRADSADDGDALEAPAR